MRGRLHAGGVVWRQRRVDQAAVVGGPDCDDGLQCWARRAPLRHRKLGGDDDNCHLAPWCLRLGGCRTGTSSRRVRYTDPNSPERRSSATRSRDTMTARGMPVSSDQLPVGGFRSAVLIVLVATALLGAAGCSATTSKTQSRPVSVQTPVPRPATADTSADDSEDATEAPTPRANPVSSTSSMPISHGRSRAQGPRCHLMLSTRTSARPPRPHTR